MNGNLLGLGPGWGSHGHGGEDGGGGRDEAELGAAVGRVGGAELGPLEEQGLGQPAKGVEVHQEHLPLARGMRGPPSACGWWGRGGGGRTFQSRLRT